MMDWLRNHAWETWLGVTVLLAVGEMLSLDFVMIMLALGAGAGMLAALVGLPFAAQALIAAGVSVAALALLRPSIRHRMHAGPSLEVGHGKLVGRQAEVTEAISGLRPGRIMLAGEIWTAAPYDEHVVIEPGQTVEVFEIRGATAYVHPVGELPPATS